MVEIAVSLISTVGIVVVAIISNRARQHAKEARTQVQNSHATNLRDDMDKIQRSVGEVLSWQESHQEISERGHSKMARLELTTAGLIAVVIFGTIAGIFRQNGT